MKNLNSARRAFAIVAGLSVGLYIGAMAFAHGSVDSLWLEYLKDAILILSIGTLLNVLASDNKWPALCVGMPLVTTSLFFFLGDVVYGMGKSQLQLSSFRLVVATVGLFLAEFLGTWISKVIDAILTKRSTASREHVG